MRFALNLCLAGVAMSFIWGFGGFLAVLFFALFGRV